MKTKARLAIIVATPLIAAMTILLGREAALSLPEKQATDLLVANRALIGIVLLYIGNFVLAWRFYASWPISMARMLVFGLIAYLCISNLVDLIGLNWEIMGVVFGDEGRASGDQIKCLRWQIGSWSVALVASSVCIAIGFEPMQRGNSEGRQ